MRAIYDYIIYTDGGCECNPGGRGGYGAVIINNNTGEFTDISGGFRSTTNNRMEVMAVIKALEKIKKDTHVQLFSDSQYVIKTMNGMFRKKKNIDLWKKLDKLAVAFEIEWNWVKGHNGNTYNERCDTLCQEAMTLLELEEDEGYMNTDSVPEQSDTVAQSLEKYKLCRLAFVTIVPSISTGLNSATGLISPVREGDHITSVNVVSTLSSCHLKAIEFLGNLFVTPRLAPYAISSIHKTNPSVGNV